MMVDDEEPWEEPTKREPREHAVAIADLMRFYRDLSEVQLECGRLCVALERRDMFGMEFSASRLVAGWRAASATIGLVEVPQVEPMQRHIARFALQACRDVVAYQLSLVVHVTEGSGGSPPGLQLLLRRLCDELGVPSNERRAELPDSRDAEAS
jgi:hypothetical protein